ncbi:MAG: glycosyltransferase [Butyrivibrio sp.]|nr:glycosyltransferase [Butyrivibrio sp.]
MRENKKISFIIPCYNTTDAILHVIDEITESMETHKGYTYEIILVNDASPNTEVRDRLVDLVDSRKEEIILVDLAKNSGQPNAILAGMRYGTGDLFMTADDDGQTPMSFVPEFIKEIENGKDVVCAKYIKRPQKSIVRKMGTGVNNIMAKALIKRPQGIEMSTIFMSKKYVIDELIKYDQPYAYISGLLLRITHNIGNVEVEQREREIGTTGYSVKKLIRLWVNGATSFSVRPLRIADAVGIIVAIIGFFMAITVSIRKLIYVDYQPGWSSLISVMLILAGVMFLILGVMGEYIGRIYLVLNKTPQSVVKSVYIKSLSERTDIKQGDDKDVFKKD